MNFIKARCYATGNVLRINLDHVTDYRSQDGNVVFYMTGGRVIKVVASMDRIDARVSAQTPFQGAVA